MTIDDTIRAFSVFLNNSYTSIPPFNFALVQDEGAGIESVFPLEEIRFELQLV